MRFGRVILILGILLTLASSAYAALFTDDTSTTDKGHFDLEYGVNYYKDAQCVYDEDSEEYYKSTLRETDLYLYLIYGLTENWDVGITLPYGYINYDRTTKSEGFMDIDIESKYRLWEEGKFIPSFALYVDLKTSSANKERPLLGTGEQDIFVNCILSKTLRENFWIDLNLGYYFTGGKAADDVFIYSLGVTGGFREKLYVYAELYGETEFEVNFNDNVCLGALSIGYEIDPHIFVKTGVAVGISDGANDLQISGRISFSF